MNPQEHQETSRVQSMSTQEWVCKGFLEGKHGGHPNLEQSRVRHQHHMYRMVLSGYTPLWGESILQKRTNSTLHNPFCTSCFSAYVFLGPWLYNTFFFKNNSFFEGGFMILISLLALPRWKDFIHVFFSIFQFLSIFDVLQTCLFHVSLLFVFGCSPGWWDCAWAVNCRDFWAWKWL